MRTFDYTGYIEHNAIINPTNDTISDIIEISPFREGRFLVNATATRSDFNEALVELIKAMETQSDETVITNVFIERIGEDCNTTGEYLIIENMLIGDNGSVLMSIK